MLTFGGMAIQIKESYPANFAGSTSYAIKVNFSPHCCPGHFFISKYSSRIVSRTSARLIALLSATFCNMALNSGVIIVVIFKRPFEVKPGSRFFGGSASAREKLLPVFWPVTSPTDFSMFSMSAKRPESSFGRCCFAMPLFFDDAVNRRDPGCKLGRGSCLRSGVLKAGYCDA